MNGFRGSRSERFFVDVHVFNPLALAFSPSSTLREFVRLSLLFLHLSSCQQWEVGAVYYKHLASLLLTKWGDEYS